MNTRKKLLVAGLIAAISMGGVGIADASPKTAHNVANATGVTQVDPDAAVLATLVTAGTITQAQSNAILAALQAAHAARPPMGGEMGEGMGQGMGQGGPRGINLQKDINVITSTLGITADQLKTNLAAGKSLATIAGAKSSALITALVAAETTEINARVTAGKLTQAQATTLIAGLTTAVTTIVNATPPVSGVGEGGHGHGGHGHGLGGAGGINPPAETPTITH